jgi:hypothetical protein
MNSPLDEIDLPPLFREVVDVLGHDRFLEIWRNLDEDEPETSEEEPGPDPDPGQHIPYVRKPDK